MISEKVVSLMKEKRKTQKEVADFIGMSAAGFRSALEIDDFRISTLGKLCLFFNLPFVYWFADHDGSIFYDQKGKTIAGKITSVYQNLQLRDFENEQLCKELEMMKQLLAAKDETIQALKSK